MTIPIRMTASLLLLASLAACADTHDLPLTYVPGVQGPPLIATPVSASVGSVSTTDLRHEADPGWYGAVRGGFGNPLKILRTPGPLADAVTQAFSDALARRGLGTHPGDPYSLHVQIVKYLSDQFINREVEIALHIELRRRRDNAVVYEDDVSIDQHEDSHMLDAGIFGSPGRLQSLNDRALSHVIDLALSKPGLLAALKGDSSRAG